MGSIHRCVLAAVLVQLLNSAGATAQTKIEDDGSRADLRTIEFTTSEVSSPDLTLSPDAQWLIFTLAGKLFRLPVKGGEAEQLTFGPYFDANPTFSPDGKLVAFDSDRDESEGNIFVLDLSTKGVKQISHEDWADRPSWSPDGKSLIYLHLIAKDRKPTFEGPMGPYQVGHRAPAEIMKISIDGGSTERLRSEEDIWSCFYLPNGDLAWTVVDIQQPDRAVSRVQTVDKNGNLTTLSTYDGMAQPVSVAPKGGILARVLGSSIADEIIHTTDPVTPSKRLANLTGAPSGFAQLPDASALFTANFGHLWRVLPSGKIQPVNFTAKVKMQTIPSIKQPVWTPAEPGAIRNVRTAGQPLMLPDGSHVVFAYGGDIWIQPFKGGPARELTKGDDFDFAPAVSPDGREVAFLHDLEKRNEMRIVDIASGKVRTVATETECDYEHISWNLKNELVFAEGCRDHQEHRLVALDLASGSKRVLVPATSSWEPQPVISSDGKTIYYQKKVSDEKGLVYRQVLPDGQPEAVFTTREDDLNTEIVGDLIAQPVQNKTGVLISTMNGSMGSKVKYLEEPDGQDFSFLRDGSGLVYISGNRIFRESFKDGKRDSVLIDIKRAVPEPPPTLIEKIRVLDFGTKGFTGEVSLLVEKGRIKQIGAVDALNLPANTLRIDGSGRFAIPGLFDSHMHWGGCGSAYEISNGMTSGRNMGGRLERQNASADRSELTNGPTPRCFYPGRIPDGKSGRLGDAAMLQPDNEEELLRYVRRAKRDGATFVKLYYRLPWKMHRAGSAEAHRLGLPVAAHGQSLVQVVKAINLGYEYLTHWAGRGTVAFYDDVIQMAKGAGIKWDPTLGVTVGYFMSFQNDPTKNYLPNTALHPMSEIAMRGMHYERMRTIRAANAAGLPLMVGTDGPTGPGLHLEMQFMADAGIPLIDILRAATLTTASAVGADKQLGSLEVGKLADIVLLDANPLDDIRNTQKIYRVMKGGWVFDPKKAAKPLNN